MPTWLAAQAEKQRTSLLRDTNKIIGYYQRAFESIHKKGEYLIDLLKLYLDSKRHDDAVTLYYEIQKQTWSGDFALPADLYNRLAPSCLNAKTTRLHMPVQNKRISKNQIISNLRKTIFS